MKHTRRHDNRYHYSAKLEWALLELLGEKSKWSGMAVTFQDVSKVREALLQATKKIRSHLEQIITADDRLLLTTAITLNSIEEEVGNLTEESNNELEIIADLLHLIAHLLGYDWLTGETNRQVVYFQTAEQECIDDMKRHPNQIHGKLEYEKRLEIAMNLYDQKLRVAQIARIMKLSEHVVKDMLVRAGKITRKEQTKQT